MTDTPTPPAIPELTKASLDELIEEAKRAGYPVSRVMLVRSETASELILSDPEVDSNFRNLDPWRAARYEKDMRADRWSLTGQGLTFGLDGKLVDGQHRLHALANSGATLPFMVCVGNVDIKVLDTGKPRSLADNLGHMGVPNRTQAAAGINLCVRLEKGLSGGGGSTFASIPEALEWLQANPAAAEAPRLANQFLRPPLKAPSSAAVTFAFYTHRIDPETFYAFRETVFSGADLHETDPRYRLREFLVRRAAQRTGKADAIFTLAVMFKAWNAYITGATPRFLTWKRAVEPFPLPLNLEGLVEPRLAEARARARRDG